MLTSQGLDFLQRQIQKNLSHGTFRIGGSLKTIPIYKINKKSSILQIMLYVTEEFSGRITEYSLVVKTGEVLMTKTDSIVKDNKRGLILVFDLETKEA